MSAALTGFEFAGFQCRTESPEDEAFLFELFASTRQAELALTHWDETTKQAFLRMQFKAMREGYAAQYPDGEFLLIWRRDCRVGRVVLDESSAELRLVDVALHPEERGRGTGTRLIRELQLRAGLAGKPLRLQVFKRNRPSAWYRRLGFVSAMDDGVYETLEWRGATGSSGPNLG